MERNFYGKYEIIASTTPKYVYAPLNLIRQRKLLVQTPTILNGAAYVTKRALDTLVRQATNHSFSLPVSAGRTVTVTALHVSLNMDKLVLHARLYRTTMRKA